MTDRRRFEVTVDGHTAVLTYREAAGRVTLIHTEVPAELRGRGTADTLARAALDDARQRRLLVRPLCPFVQAFMKRHRSTRTSRLRRRRREDPDDGTECGGSLGRHASRGQGPRQARQRRVRGPLLVPLAVRGRHGHQSGGADRRRPRGLLLHGPVGRAQPGEAHAAAHPDDRARAPRERGRRLPPDADRARHGGRGAGPRRQGVHRSTPRRPRRPAPSRWRWPPSPSASPRGSCRVGPRPRPDAST